MELSPSLIVALSLCAAVVWALMWWRERRELADLRRRLARSEESRFLLGKQAHEIEARLAAMDAQWRSRAEPTVAAVGAPLVDDDAPPLSMTWPDTQTIEEGDDPFEPTQPIPRLPEGFSLQASPVPSAGQR